jgi:hypothetical protein
MVLSAMKREFGFKMRILGKRRWKSKELERHRSARSVDSNWRGKSVATASCDVYLSCCGMFWVGAFGRGNTKFLYWMKRENL